MACKNLLAFLVILTLFVSVFGAAFHRIERSIPVNQRENREVSRDICENRSPCGWAVYTPFTRVVDYFIKNKCECPNDKKCIRDNDDVSVSAFVYRCSTPKPGDQINNS